MKQFICELLYFLLYTLPIGVIFICWSEHFSDTTGKRTCFWVALALGATAASLTAMAINEAFPFQPAKLPALLVGGAVAFVIAYLSAWWTSRKHAGYYIIPLQDPKEMWATRAFSLALCGLGLIPLFFDLFFHSGLFHWAMVLSLGLTLGCVLFDLYRLRAYWHAHRKDAAPFERALRACTGVQIPARPADLSLTLEEQACYYMENAPVMDIRMQDFAEAAKEKPMPDLSYSYVSPLAYTLLKKSEPRVAPFKTAKQLHREIQKSLEPFYEYLSAFVEDYRRDCTTILAGYAGENRVKDALSQYEGPDFTCLYNLRFRSGPITSECDAIILCPGGIFCVEIKNYGEDANWTLRVAADGQWTRVYANKEFPLEGDPFAQNLQHVHTLQERFGDLLGGGEQAAALIHPIVCIPSNVVIHNETANLVLRPFTLYSTITQAYPPHPFMTRARIQALAAAMREAGIPSNRYPCRDYVTESAQIREILLSATYATQTAKEHFRPPFF